MIEMRVISLFRSLKKKYNMMTSSLVRFFRAVQVLSLIFLLHATFETCYIFELCSTFENRKKKKS